MDIRQRRGYREERWNICKERQGYSVKWYRLWAYISITQLPFGVIHLSVYILNVLNFEHFHDQSNIVRIQNGVSLHFIMFWSLWKSLSLSSLYWAEKVLIMIGYNFLHSDHESAQNKHESWSYDRPIYSSVSLLEGFFSRWYFDRRDKAAHALRPCAINWITW